MPGKRWRAHVLPPRLRGTVQPCPQQRNMPGRHLPACPIPTRLLWQHSGRRQVHSAGSMTRCLPGSSPLRHRRRYPPESMPTCARLPQGNGFPAIRHRCVTASDAPQAHAEHALAPRMIPGCFPAGHHIQSKRGLTQQLFQHVLVFLPVQGTGHVDQLPAGSQAA